jgi:hypothetical protein
VPEGWLMVSHPPYDSASARDPAEAGIGGLTGANSLVAKARRFSGDPTPSRLIDGGMVDSEFMLRRGVIIVAESARGLERLAPTAVSCSILDVRPLTALDDCRQADVPVVVLLDAYGDVSTSRLLLVRAASSAPMVVVSDSETELNQLRELGVACIRYRMIDRDLEGVLDQAKLGHALRSLARALQRSIGMPAKLRDALALAFGSQGKALTVAVIARRVACDRSTLAREWRVTVAQRTSLRFKDVLDWLLLIHARIRKTQGMTWERVAAALRTHPHTIQRVAHRLTGQTLSAITGAETGLLYQAFARSVVAPLAASLEASNPSANADARNIDALP